MHTVMNLFTKLHKCILEIVPHSMKSYSFNSFFPHAYCFTIYIISLSSHILMGTILASLLLSTKTHGLTFDICRFKRYECICRISF